MFVIRCFALIGAILIWLKTFFMGFYLFSLYPRLYQPLDQISLYSKPKWYLLVSGSLNVLGSLAGFWLFAGVCELSQRYFLPSFIALSVYLFLEVAVHILVFVIGHFIHMIIIINIAAIAMFSLIMMVEFLFYKTIER